VDVLAAMGVQLRLQRVSSWRKPYSSYMNDNLAFEDPSQVTARQFCSGVLLREERTESAADGRVSQQQQQEHGGHAKRNSQHRRTKLARPLHGRHFVSVRCVFTR
jgi:hypothetical protein